MSSEMPSLSEVRSPSTNLTCASMEEEEEEEEVEEEKEEEEEGGKGIDR
jgi:hypothetical protein